MRERPAADLQRTSYTRALWDVSEFPIIGPLALLAVPFTVFADVVMWMVRVGG